MTVSTPLVNHRQEPGIEPILPIRIIRRHRARQGTDMILAVPLTLTLEQKVFYRIIGRKKIRLQIIAHILDTHTDVGELYLQRHTLLHTGIHRLIAPIILFLRPIFCAFHYRIITEIIFLTQKSDHTHDIVTQLLAVVIHTSGKVVSLLLINALHRFFCAMKDFIQRQGQGIFTIIRKRISCHQEIGKDRRLGHLHLCLYKRLIKRSKGQEGLLVNPVGSNLLIR